MDNMIVTQKLLYYTQVLLRSLLLFLSIRLASESHMIIFNPLNVDWHQHLMNILRLKMRKMVLPVRPRGWLS